MNDELGPLAAADAMWASQPVDPRLVVVRNAGDIVPSQIPPRGWLLGTSFCRKFLSGLIGVGGAAKTTIRYAQYLALATGRNLTGEHVHHRVPVLIVCLEDDLTEVQRRIAAAMLYHEVEPAEVRDHLLYCCPRGLKILQIDPGGGRVAGDLHGQLDHIVARLGIGLVAIDPFVKSHGVDENDNRAMDEVCMMLCSLADQYDCAIDIVHHGRKGNTEPGDADRSRGASATVSAGRLMRTATTMTAEEAELFGIALSERASFVRVDDAKINLAPRSGDASWFRLVSVALGNGTHTYPNGDHIQTVERWMPPDLWRAPTSVFNAILDDIDEGLAGGRRYSDQNAARDRAAWPIVVKHLDRTEEQARKMVKTWVEKGVLVVEDYDDPVDRKPRKGLRVNPAKRPGDVRHC
jgi:hypothetical protein